jgi:hypothetical protein
VDKLETITERVPVWGGTLGLELTGFRNDTRQEPHEVTTKTAFATVKINYQVNLAPQTNNLSPGGTKQLQVSLSPSNEIPAANIVYKYTRTGNQGTLDIANGVETPNNTVTYTASANAQGGSDQIQVTAYSKVAGVIVETIGSGAATVQVDLLHATFSIFTQSTPAHPEGFVAARITIAKVPGATSYEVTATTPDGPYSKTFSGAETTNQQSVGQVIDGGSVWHINLEAGFSTTDAGVNGRKNDYNTKYGNVVFNVKVNQ